MTTGATHVLSFFDRRGRLGVKCLWLAVALTWMALIIAAYRTTEAQDLRIFWEATQAFVHGRSPYAIHLFVYPPSALLLLSPLGMVSFPAARLAYAVVDSLAVVVATVACVRLFHIPMRSAVVPLVLLAVVCFSPVGSDIHLGNVNGLLVAGEAAGLLMVSRGRWGEAGLLIGLSLALKPVLLPLLLLFVLWRQWRALALAVAVPVGLSAIGFVFLSDPGRFFSGALPFLLTADANVFRDFNASLSGAGQLLGAPAWAVVPVRVAVVVMGLVLAVVRFQRGGDRALLLVDCSSLLLLTAFLSFQFSWNYYGLYFVPLLVSVVNPLSLMRHPLAWLGLLLIGSPDVWLWRHGSVFVTHLAAMRVTAGMLVLLCAYLVHAAELKSTILAIGRRDVPLPPFPVSRLLPWRWLD